MAEILIKNGTTAGGEDGDVVVAITEARAKKAWDQMLERGRVTQKQYDDAQVDGKFTWPWTSNEKKEFILLACDMTDKETGDLVAPDETNKFSHNVDITKVTYYSDTDKARKTISAESIAEMKDTKVETDIRLDKPILKTEITKKVK